jgi:hypothetical protein
MTDEEEIENVEKINDIDRLAKIITSEQSEYWCDSCGKSGRDLNMKLTALSAACVRQIHSLIGLGKLT